MVYELSYRWYIIKEIQQTLNQQMKLSSFFISQRINTALECWKLKTEAIYKQRIFPGWHKPWNAAFAPASILLGRNILDNFGTMLLFCRTGSNLARRNVFKEAEAKKSSYLAFLTFKCLHNTCFHFSMFIFFYILSFIIWYKSPCG